MNVNQLLWFSVTIALLPNLSADKICTGKKADIIFIIDSSGSMGDEKFLQVQASIKSFAGKLELGPGKTQLGFVQYGSYAKDKKEVKLQADRSEADNIAAIDGLSGTGGITNLPSGVCLATLQTTRTDADVKKIYVILSRGETNQKKSKYFKFPKVCRTYKDKTKLFDLAKEKTDAIVAISLQVSKPDTENLQALTTKIFDSDLTSGLESLLESQIKEILNCKPHTTPPPTPDPCAPKKDVVFIIDTSASMGEEAFNKTRCAIKAFAEGLKLGPEKIQLGFAQYSTYAKPDVAVDMDAQRSEADNKANIDSLKYDGVGGFTNLPNGVCLANTFTFRGDGVPVHYIIISRGETNKDKLMKPCKGADIEQTLTDTKNSGKIISAISLKFSDNDSVTIGKLINDQKDYYKDISEDAIEVVLDSIGFHHRF